MRMAGFIIFSLLLLTITRMVCGYATVVSLKRLIPPSHELSLTQLTAFDSARHGRLLQSPVRGTFHFPVEAQPNTYITALHYTTLKLGTPQREFNVIIDTGSDVLWVNCISWIGCPTTGVLRNLSFFDPEASSSAIKFPCSDKRCYSNLPKKSSCASQESCSYKLEYGDGSVTSGYYISDAIWFDTVISSNLTVKSSAPLVFGCSNVQSGPLCSLLTTVDGIVGLGKGRLSLISQLSSQRLAPSVFSLCLSGDKGGGGVMVLGQNKRPDAIYTPLVPSKTHYNVNLQRIAVNDQLLSIDPSVFNIATGYGTIIDSGTILAYFPVEAYDPLVQAISNTVLRYWRPVTYESFQCYNTTSRISSNQSVADTFPEVSLGFAGGASMVLKPHAYLFTIRLDVENISCLGFQSRVGHRITIIGEVALSDKMIIYDLANQRIGWADYNCSLDAIRGARSKDIVNTRQEKGDSTKSGNRSDMLLVSLMIPLLLLFLFF